MCSALSASSISSWITGGDERVEGEGESCGSGTRAATPNSRSAVGGPCVWRLRAARQCSSVCLGAEVAPPRPRDVHCVAADVRDVILPCVFATGGEHLQARS